MHSRRSGVGKSFRVNDCFSFLYKIVKGVMTYHGSIYAIGGFNGTSRLNTGERYNPTMNTWRAITDMFHPRSNFAIEVTIIKISYFHFTENLS